MKKLNPSELFSVSGGKTDPSDFPNFPKSSSYSWDSINQFLDIQKSYAESGVSSSIASMAKNVKS